MPISIVTDRGTHLLITDGEKSAVIERRDDHFYNCHDGRRRGVPATNLHGVASILDANDWTDRETAQATFADVVARGSRLAQRML